MANTTEYRLKMKISSRHEIHHPKMEYQLDLMEVYSDQPERVNLIIEALTKLEGIGLLEKELDENAFWSVLNSVHTPSYLEALKYLSGGIQDSKDYLYPVVHPRRLPLIEVQIPQIIGYYAMDNFAPVGKHTYTTALNAAKTAFTCASELLEEPSVPVYALVRPPGHHAGPDYMGGYCYFNNAAVAAQVLKTSGRVAILDIDYHHGNGTQEIFWDDPEVLFVSLHSAPDDEYPYYSGRTSEQGGGAAKGMNRNFPMPVGTNGKSYISVLKQALKVISSFSPAFLVISLGVDTYKNDPTGKFLLEKSDYRTIGQRLGETGLPMLFIQEGGYNLQETGNLVAELLSYAYKSE